ncbi:hypothetical protein PsorP6_003684 [Peronosclerospora sorghi]|uniref:Uncharacterized protein n=1 Tax=Peronosclerospora sorghi TaxID=230839 RepID=A0ACC0VPT3_9STRA|nr:hypothetical protein PsorP6_003684 [Peronosclerospora sorghi]
MARLRLAWLAPEAKPLYPGEVSAEDEERSTSAWSSSMGTVPIDSPVIVVPTTPFDGGMKTYKRSNVAFRSGARMTRESAVFVVKAGGTLSKLFESCGTCGPVKRGIIVDGAVSVNPTAELIRINSNYNDRGAVSRATITTTNSNYPIFLRFNGGIPAEQIGFGDDPPVW